MLVISASLATPAHAQTLFETLFGWANPKPKAKVITHTPRRRSAFRDSVYPGINDWGDAAPLVPKVKRRTYRYRTVCVRVCDGYYFPISFATSRSGLQRDSDICRQRCGAMGALYYTPSPHGDIDKAVDLDGRKYADLNDAYRYRKTYVKGCSCRAQPWSRSERARHASYADKTETADASSAKAPAVIVGGNYEKTSEVKRPVPSASASRDDGAVQPESTATAVPRVPGRVTGPDRKARRNRVRYNSRRRRRNGSNPTATTNFSWFAASQPTGKSHRWPGDPS
ncbi:MAG: DUF2865 domain-containing protein [Pseudomonadota bacterium]